MSETTGTTIATPAYPVANVDVSDYRSPFKGWQREYPEGQDSFRENMRNYPIAGGAARIWDEAHAENQFRSDSFPATFVRDVAEAHTLALDEKITRVLRAEFPGAIPDTAETKLRALIEGKRNAERREAEALLARDEALANLHNAQSNVTEEITDPYDERVIHFFVTAAQEANSAGYCSVYDQISNAANLPTRDEMSRRGLLAREYIVDGQVTVTFNVTQRVTATSQEEAEQNATFGVDDDNLQNWVYSNRYDASNYEIDSESVSAELVD